MRLAGKVAIVTGAARSIGAAIAECYAREGASVVVNDVARPELLQQVVAGIAASGGNAVAVQADVSREDGAEALAETAVRSFGGIDVLVNNAAIDPRREWTAISVEEWDRVMGVNVRSQFLCAKAVFPAMSARRSGKIINVSSVTFFTGQRGYVHYVASKGAVVGLTRALAREVGEIGITVNCVAPGAIYTETEAVKIGDEASRAAGDRLAEVQAIPRRGETRDLAGVFLFLAGSESDFVTGQTFGVDGGWVMR